MELFLRLELYLFYAELLNIELFRRLNKIYIYCWVSHTFLHTMN